MAKGDDQKIAALIKKNAAKAAAKPKRDLRRQYDSTLPPAEQEEDLDARDLFKEMKKREF